MPKSLLVVPVPSMPISPAREVNPETAASANDSLRAPMRVTLLTPAPLGSPQGNAVTVARIARGLAARGIDVRASETSESVAAGSPTIIHAFHAYRTGPRARALADACGARLVVTLTGTDVSDDLVRPETGAIVRDVLRSAAAVTVFHESVASTLTAVVPEISSRLAVVPQSVCFPSPPAEPATSPALGDPCIVFPAGIRPVKQPRLPLAPLDALARRRPAMRLWYAGPVLDHEEHRRLLFALDARPWASYLGAVAHHAMPALLASADIVLNCSRSEGGMANAVLEALALGRAVLVSDIPGNRSLVEDGVTGHLFGSEAELADKAERLAADPALRRRLGEAGRYVVETRFTPAIETEGYLAVYARVESQRAGS